MRRLKSEVPSILDGHLSITSKFQALNRLTLRGIWLMLEASADDPPELVVFENVPLVQTRGKHLLDMAALYDEALRAGAALGEMPADVPTPEVH